MDLLHYFFYHYYEIETPHLEKLREKHKENIQDIPTREQIKLAVEHTNNMKIKALILFLASSGTSIKEALNITIQDFIEATRDYHDETSITSVIQVLEHRKLVVPIFYLYREKTDTNYYTFCSHEAVQYILRYLKHRCMRENVTQNSQLFNVTYSTAKWHFNHINDQLSWGWRGKHHFFHAHALRKFFATQLLGADMDSITINFLSGRSINATQQAYFKADPSKLRKKYIVFMQNVTIMSDITVHDIDTKEREELYKLQRTVQENERQIQELESMIRKLLK